MAYWVNENHRGTGKKSFCCDTVEDIDKLPTTTRKGAPTAAPGDDETVFPGSDYLCLEDSSVGILGMNPNVWRKK